MMLPKFKIGTSFNISISSSKFRFKVELCKVIELLENLDACKRCAKCCKGTEMILTFSDIFRLKKFYKNFYIFDRFYRLKNVDGKCVFLENNLCKVYNIRPIGCKAYPLIYNEEKGIIIDDECPLKKISKEELLKGLKEILCALKEIERDYRYKVNWRLVKKSKKLLEKQK